MKIGTIITRDMVNHPPSKNTQERMEIIRAAYHDVVAVISAQTGDETSRELSLAITNLEQSLMWSIAHLARTDYDRS